VRAEQQRFQEGPDPVADAIDQLVAVYSLKANAVSLRTADKMVGTVINLKA
jgi:flagellar hook protein FlgE